LNQDTLYNSFIHTDQGIEEVLHQTLEKIGWPFTIPHPGLVQEGWQATITLSSSTDSVQTFGETFLMHYMARDSAYIYTLDYVDRFIKINIININYALYFQKIHSHEVNDPRF
jgi:hypothetical protein